NIASTLPTKEFPKSLHTMDYREGKAGLRRNLVEALERLYKAAEQGLSEKQHNMGSLHSEGRQRAGILQ
ncbi:hypothetical protein BGX24_006328, partial [Mortierella sp. AD032]